ncbi:TonB-dependent receptor domain-containing protein [Flammeovirga agarivorans]|uniref:TonB-dependent receptor n=1 Tax=Flammeovirga agarivorans TaxID=2726742 RepID=A0A7X8XWI1_9BACT|nr:TonB-dependent receptor [Flammeovirga agarivorans]NLR92281.1 TonB-dependent receptor [Flammeovirga agarivorans]
MTKRYLFIISLFIFLSNIAYSQVTLSGVVTLSTTQKSEAGVDVFVKGTYSKVVTNKKGYYQIKGLKLGETYTIGAFKYGFSPVEKVIKVDKKNIQINFTLRPLEKVLDEVAVIDQNSEAEITRLEAVEGTSIYEGKKSEVINIDNLTANLATNNSRQVYNRVPGLNIWESDGAGIQLGIGGRGLSPNRTSNFNTRQNGYDIAADALGYPESYYTPPLEAVQEVQIVRGAASLQYGTQFGGLLNFKMKKGNPEKPFEFQTRQTVGSFGLFNSFNSIGGQKGDVNYYAMYQYKRGDGWRPNSGFNVNTVFTGVEYEVNDKFKIGVEFTHMDYLAQQPGGLTDEEFYKDPRASYTDQNWFKVNWNIASVNLQYQFTPKAKIEMRNFGLYASRDALGINLNKENPYSEPRLLVSDQFRNVGSEIRYMQHYDINGKSNVFVLGTRLYHGNDDKKQGDASDGNDADFTFSHPDSLLSDHNFQIQNYAFFAENIFQITDKFSVTPGIRFEIIKTTGKGYYQKIFFETGDDGLIEKITRPEQDNIINDRTILIGGVGVSYKPNNDLEVYANVSQNYRAITYSDLRSLNSNIRIDPDMKDESGYSADLGVRGSLPWLSYDVSGFYLRYNDKIGLANPANPIRTNIADAYTLGVESYAEFKLLEILSPLSDYRFNVFGNVAFIQGKYISDDRVYDGNDVELVPPFNIKSGINTGYKSFNLSLQYTYVEKQYTDAANSEKPLPDGIYGPIPAYYVMDLSMKYVYKWFGVETGINNLTNNMYFTRRATGYPGPGIIPSDGRNYYVTLQFKI